MRHANIITTMCFYANGDEAVEEAVLGNTTTYTTARARRLPRRQGVWTQVLQLDRISIELTNRCAHAMKHCGAPKVILPDIAHE
jgi:hypothetical protein